MARASNRWLATKRATDLESQIKQAVAEINEALAEGHERYVGPFGPGFSISRLNNGLRTVRAILTEEE